MERLFYDLWGYVRVSLQGGQTERFLNLCKSSGIRIRQLTRTKEGNLEAVFSVKDFFKLRPLLRKTKVHIHILEKHGLPFFFWRNKKRKAFFLGFVFAVGVLFLLSGRIWNIHIEGNVANSTPEILTFLQEKGITHGIAKNSIDCSQIAAMIRKEYPQITWVSARMEGTRLLLTIQEGTKPQELLDQEEEPCNITADQEGTIVKMITRRGTPLFKTGDTCRKGDVLVLGRLDYRNDSQEVYRYEYVHGDADIYVQHELSYYHELPLTYEETVMTGKKRRGFFFKAGPWYLQFGKKQEDGWIRLTEEKQIYLTETFALPFRFGWITDQAFQIEKKTYTKEEARKKAAEILYLYEEKLIEKGVQISENNVKIEIDHMTCISRGTLLVVEKTGIETPVQIQEQPQADLLGSDGQ